MRLGVQAGMRNFNIRLREQSRLSSEQAFRFEPTKKVQTKTVTQTNDILATNPECKPVR
jgi:hypothetical protein